jgi:hypothetical protein
VRCVHASLKARRVTEGMWPDLHLITHAFRIREVAALMENPLG